MQATGSRIESPGAALPATFKAGDKLRMDWGANVHKTLFLPSAKNHAHSGYSPSSAFPVAYEFCKTMISIQQDRLSTVQPSFY